MLPGATPDKETVLEPGELIVAVRLPAAATAFAANARYVKLRERTSYAFAVVSAAAALKLEGDKIAEARLALGSVAAKPWRANEAEAALRGKPAGEAAFRAAAEAALASAQPAGDNAYKIELARRIIVRALTDWSSINAGLWMVQLEVAQRLPVLGCEQQQARVRRQIERPFAETVKGFVHDEVEAR